MNKSSYFTGQPVFSQLVSSISKRMVRSIAGEYKADYYSKKFDTWHHLITMLYSILQHCTSLREVETGMLACEGRLQSLGIRHFPKKSTLGDANLRRNAEVFEQIFKRLLEGLQGRFPDSRLDKRILKKLFIIDATTLALFSEIFKAAGRTPADGKRKGGVKVHMAVQAKTDMPCLVAITSSAANDNVFTRNITLPRHSYVVFDKGYHSHGQLNRFADQEVWWVTRQRSNAIVEVIEEKTVSQAHQEQGVQKDELIVMGHPTKKIAKVSCRRVTYFDTINNKKFQFITNHTSLAPTTVAAIYKQRWQIELIFKRIKQNTPLQYFLGDNENAIRIQIWCTLIADLLLHGAIAKTKRKWAFSNLCSLVRLHLMNYTNLGKFLEDPDKARIAMPQQIYSQQLNLLFSG
jgi:hypothetical protein